MTAPQPSIPAISLKWGLLTGLLFIIYSLITYLTNSFGNMFIGMFVTIVMAIIGIVLAMRDFRSSNGGYMSYGQGLGLGILVIMIATLLSALFSYIYIQFVDPTITEKMVDAAMAQIERMGVDESVIDEQREKALADSSPGKQILGALANGFFTGLLLSLIISAIMKRKRPEFE